MRFKTPNVKGFSIIEVIASLLILTLALGSILMTSLYASVKAENNYHYRAALLAVYGEMEQIQCARKITGGRFMAPPGSVTFATIENGKPIKGNLSYTLTQQPDMQIGLGVRYHILSLSIEWREALASPVGQTKLGEIRRITLREDYYYRQGAL